MSYVPVHLSRQFGKCRRSGIPSLPFRMHYKLKDKKRSLKNIASSKMSSFVNILIGQTNLRRIWNTQTLCFLLTLHERCRFTFLHHDIGKKSTTEDLSVKNNVVHNLDFIALLMSPFSNSYYLFGFLFYNKRHFFPVYHCPTPKFWQPTWYQDSGLKETTFLANKKELLRIIEPLFPILLLRKVSRFSTLLLSVNSIDRRLNSFIKYRGFLCRRTS